MDIIESRSYHLYAWTQEHKEKVMNEDGTEEYLDSDDYRDSSWTLSFYYFPSTIFGVYVYVDAFYVSLATTIPLAVYWFLMRRPAVDRFRVLTIPVAATFVVRPLIFVPALIWVPSSTSILFIGCQILTPFLFFVNSFLLLLAHSPFMNKREMGIAFLISFISVNVVLVVLVFTIYILLDHEASVFYSIIVLLGHVIMTVSPILCIITIVASLLVRRVAPPKSDQSSEEVSKSRFFWTSLFVLVASIPMLCSMLFSALRVGEAIRFGTVLYDYKYAGWYSDLTDRRSVNYSVAAVQYLRSSNIMPSLHDIFPMWYMCCLILLFQPFRSQLLSVCQRNKGKIASPPTSCSTDAVVSIEPPIQNQVPQ